MLKSHLEAIEQQLLATSKIPANSGHSIHKGTPREAFIKEFLEGHLSERLAVGTGEIIDAYSKPGDRRNQIDIVLHKRDYPKLQFGGGISGFLIESVVATIEVKSFLTKVELSKAITAACQVKRLRPHVVICATSGYNPPGPLCFVVAYDGPASMKTVHGWISEIHAENGVEYHPMPIEGHRRLAVPAPSIDGVFLLGKGFLQFDNSPQDFFNDDFRRQHPDMRWQGADVKVGALLMLFIRLTSTACNTTEMWLNPNFYLQTFIIPPGQFWPLP